jgi:acetyl esterase/lipase
MQSMHCYKKGGYNMSIGSELNYHVIKLLAKRLHIELAKNMPIPPKKLYQKYVISQKSIMERNCFIVQQQKNVGFTAAIYLHGGGYQTNFTIQHWRLIDQLMTCSKIDMICPDYPLLPKTFVDAYQYLEELYDMMIRIYPSIILIGDSAGGGFALGFTQYLASKQKTLPTKLILISPWLDVSMSNEEILKIDRIEPMLELSKVLPAGKAYSMGNMFDYRVSPIYGEFRGLPPIHIITGTYDILYADIIKLEEIAKKNQYNINISVYPKMIHVFPILSFKEAKQARNEIISHLCESEGESNG